MKLSTKVCGLLLMGGVAFSTCSFAQDEAGQLVAGSREDATTLAKAYLTPFFKGVGLGLNSGWTNSGSVKKLGRFEIRICASGALVPSSDRTYDVSSLGLQRVRPTANNRSTIAQTFAGKDEEGPELQAYDANGKPIPNATFNLPGGFNPTKNYVLAPQLQASVGLIKGFEATLRFTPAINIPDDHGEISVIGGGLKFQPLRFISKKGNALLPVDLAVALGWSRLKYEDEFQRKGPDGRTFDDQKIEAKISGFNSEVILSKKLLFFTPFVSLGYQTSTTDAGIKGTYSYASGYTGTPQAAIVTYETMKDPVSINEKYVNSMRASVGATLNLFLFRIYGSYNMASYNYVNVGLGFGFGK